MEFIFFDFKSYTRYDYLVFLTFAGLGTFQLFVDDFNIQNTEAHHTTKL